MEIVATAIAVLALGVSVWALFYAQKQTKLAKRSADIAEDALQLEAEAELFLQVIRRPQDQGTVWIIPDGMTTEWRISNSGRSPALRVRLAVHVGQDPEPQLDAYIGDLPAGVTRIVDDSDWPVALLTADDVRRLEGDSLGVVATVTWVGRRGVEHAFRTDITS